MKRVFIIHCWGGKPKDNWYPWLKAQLEKKGFQVFVPEMPDTEHPRIETWVPLLEKLVGKPDKDTYLVGHSIGCQTIMRFLERAKKPVGGVVFVAGWFTLSWAADATQEEIGIARPWIEQKIEVRKAKKNSGRIIALFSDNDPFVPMENVKLFEQRLGAKTILEHKQGHYSNGVTTLRTALESVLEIAT